MVVIGCWDAVDGSGGHGPINGKCVGPAAVVVREVTELEHRLVAQEAAADGQDGRIE